MKLNYLGQLKQSNISVEDLIPSTQKKIGELNQLLNAIQSLEQKKSEEDDKDLISQYDNKIEEIKQAAEQYDFDITKKIAKNDFYKENAKKMKEGRNKQKPDNSVNQNLQSKVVETQQQTQTKTEPKVENKTQNAQASVINKDGTETKLDVKEEKKGIGVGSILFGVFALAITAGAYNYFKNRE